MTLQDYKVVFTVKYNSLLTKFVQCERSECELPETGLMRFGAMRISVNEPLVEESVCSCCLSLHAVKHWHTRQFTKHAMNAAINN